MIVEISIGIDPQYQSDLKGNYIIEKGAVLSTCTSDSERHFWND